MDGFNQTIFDNLATNILLPLHNVTETILNGETIQYPIDKKFEIENDSCHGSTKEEKSKNLCFECDCYLTQLLSNVVSSSSILNISKFNFEFIIKHYSINKKVKDPPPKKIS